MTTHPLARALLIATLAAAPAGAADKGVLPESPATLGGTECDLGGAKSVSQPLDPAFLIPDNNRAFALVGVLSTEANGDTLGGVTLELNIAHTWMGDLEIRLEYVDCGSGTPLHTADIVCRPRGTNLLAPAPCGAGTSAGCGGNLGSSAASAPPPAPASYFFSDSSAATLGDGSCPALAGPGCYLPTMPGALAGFRGLLKGGCWRLSVADWAAEDTGRIDYWAVWMDNTPEVATRRASWGRLKSIYR